MSDITEQEMILSLSEDEMRYLDLAVLLRTIAKIDETLSVTNPELASRFVETANRVLAQRLGVQ
jgi:hypothetical protein